MSFSDMYNEIRAGAQDLDQQIGGYINELNNGD